MKKSIFVSAIIMVFVNVINAQTPREAAIKGDIKNLKKEESAIKKEIKADKAGDKTAIHAEKAKGATVKKEIRTERKELRRLKGKDASAASKQAFISDFGNIPVMVWERSNHFDEATFTKDGQVLTAFYDGDAKLVGTTSEKSFSDIPMKAQNYIGEKYPGYSISEVVMFDDNNNNDSDMFMYSRQFEGKDTYFAELKKDNKKIVVRVNMDGDVMYFTRLR